MTLSKLKRTRPADRLKPLSLAESALYLTNRQPPFLQRAAQVENWLRQHGRTPFEFMYFLVDKQLNDVRQDGALLSRTNLVLSHSVMDEFLVFRRQRDAEIEVEVRLHLDKLRVMVDMGRRLKEILENECTEVSGPVRFDQSIMRLMEDDDDEQLNDETLGALLPGYRDQLIISVYGNPVYLGHLRYLELFWDRLNAHPSTGRR